MTDAVFSTKTPSTNTGRANMSASFALAETTRGRSAENARDKGSAAMGTSANRWPLPWYESVAWAALYAWIFYGIIAAL